MLTHYGNKFQPLGVTLLRLALGIIFLYHGGQKVSDLSQWSQNFAHIGYPPATVYLIGPLEAIGGAMLVLGLFTRLFALLLAGDLLVAFLTVHLPKGPITQVSRYELQMLLSGASFALFCWGPGPFSIDALWEKRKRS
jgi:putative oxidoreductase